MIINKSRLLILSLILCGSTAFLGITVPYKNFFLDPMPMMVKEEMISPNGNYVASLDSEPEGRVLKIQKLLENNDGNFILDTTHPITHIEPRIAGLMWTRDSHYLLFLKIKEGMKIFTFIALILLIQIKAPLT
ncbi:MAG: hypothetical protein ACOYK6_02805 [Chthoniobacterales bacterium]